MKADVACRPPIDCFTCTPLALGGKMKTRTNQQAALCSADELVAIANPRMAPPKAEAMET